SSSGLRPSSPVGWRDFRAGFVGTMPLWLGVAPFGAIYAVTARAAGLSAAQTLAMSLLVFAGAAQFTAAGLFASGAAPLAIVITTLIINARHALLAASLAPFVRRERPALKALLGYQLGSNISLYMIWQCSTVGGMLFSAQMPDTAAYGLDLVFPLTFIGLLVP